MIIRVVTFNVHRGKYPDRIANAIKSNENLAKADVFLLQEVEEYSHESVARAEKIACLLGFAYVYAPARAVRGGTHGLAILSRYPLESVNKIALPFFKLQPFRRNRISLIAYISVGHRRVCVANVHLDTRLSSDERAMQIKPVIDAMENNRSGRVILGGDFNTLPFRFRHAIPVAFCDQKEDLRRYLEGSGFVTRCANAGHTLKKGFIELELDRIYVRHFDICECGVERSVAVSDHKPFWIDVKI
jgi:endonuclease/exonuclease/phosphatase family metal-dependent hydrolase